MTRAGVVAIVGRPNAGKSSLLNRLLGQKLSITSPKPQSTRNQITGLLSRGDSQAILVDTPGLLDPGYLLQTALRNSALRALEDADAVLYVADASSPPVEPLAAVLWGLAPRRVPPSVTVLNKADLLRPEQRAEVRQNMPDALLASARTGDGMPELLDAVDRMLPDGPFLYPEEELSSLPVRFFVAELVRETALEQLEGEVPYSVACQVEEFRDGSDPIYIRAVLYLERESQKRIVIGEGGTRIRSIGQRARLKIEGLVGGRVYLDLWVKVLKNWRRDQNALRRLGYDPQRRESR